MGVGWTEGPALLRCSLELSRRPPALVFVSWSTGGPTGWAWDGILLCRLTQGPQLVWWQS